MLARLALAVADDALRTRLRELASTPDTVVAELRTAAGLAARSEDHDLLVVDTGTLGDDGPQALAGLRAAGNAPEILVVADVLVEERAALLAAGALAVVPDRLPDEPFLEVLRALVERRREALELQRVADAAAEHEPDFGEFLAVSPSMTKLLQIARKLSRSDSTMLILGETGVGKERLARSIHSQGKRAGGPFVVLNCGAVPESLLETELFGHERGAFTGAERAHRGHFELAHRGTIFLDEIGELPLHLQVKLLRVLQERTIQRIGSEKAQAVDVRIIAATNRDLQTEMQEKRFRSDLYYRLNVVTLSVPPLRERRDDIPRLVDTYFQQFCAQMTTPARSVSAEAMLALQSYYWPGNIRELVNVVERAVLLCDGEEVTPADFPDAVTAAALPEPDARELPATAGRGDLAEALDATWLDRPLAEARHAWNARMERAYLSGLLRETRGRVGATAARAGIDPRSLYTKMKQLGLRKEEFRD